jgi:tRNA (guanine-N7-)-methyltransferase
MTGSQTAFEVPGVAENRFLRSFGRRKGHRLSPRKERLVADLLPRLRPPLERPPPRSGTDLFAVPVEALWLEIGFGSGEHLLAQARANPSIGILGCEPFINGVASLLGVIEDEDLSNVLVHDGDARDVLTWLPPASIARVFVLFPDPWPKKRHSKRRLLQTETMTQIARVLEPGGELRFASDDPDYVEEVMGAAAKTGLLELRECCSERPVGWPETRYERKAVSEGRKPGYLCFAKRP